MSDSSSKTKSDLLKAARAQVPEVLPAELAKIAAAARPALIDVREKNEGDAGLIPGAQQIPRGYLELRIEQAIPAHDSPIVVYCQGGTRSLLAGRTLREMGYTNVRSLAGGFDAWKSQGNPVDVPVRLTDAQRSRARRGCAPSEWPQK